MCRSPPACGKGPVVVAADMKSEDKKKVTRAATGEQTVDSSARLVAHRGVGVCFSCVSCVWCVSFNPNVSIVTCVSFVSFISIVSLFTLSFCRGSFLAVLYVNGKFTEDREEWQQELHRQCEGVCTDPDETQEVQEGRVEYFKRKGDQHFTDDEKGKDYD